MLLHEKIMLMSSKQPHVTISALRLPFDNALFVAKCRNLPNVNGKTLHRFTRLNRLKLPNYIRYYIHLLHTELQQIRDAFQALIIRSLIIFCHGCIRVPHQGGLVRIGSRHVFHQV